MDDKNSTKVLAFDFGASSGRAIIGTLKDGKIEMEEIHRFMNDPVVVGDTMYWDTLRQYFEIKQGIVKAKNRSDFESIGIDTWGVDFALLDMEGRLLENAIHYRDPRTIGMQDKVFETLSKEELYQISGNQFENFNTIFQLYSLVLFRPELLQRADTLLMTSDLFNYFLCGVKKAEYTMASTTQLMDAKKRVWSDRILNALKIPAHLMPELVASGSIIGTVDSQVCEELEIEPKKVIAVAAHDTQSASIAVPTLQKDFMFISCGTWSLFGTEIDEPIINRATYDLNISNEGGFGKKATLLKNILGLWLVQESRRQWIREGKEYGFGELEAMAQEVQPLQCFINPAHADFMPAGNIPARISTYCVDTKQKAPQSIGEIVCCINQSLALMYRYTLEQIEESTGKTYEIIYMIGGGIQSKMLCQMTANAINRKVVAGPVEATALGNIAVQLIALGKIENLTEARRIISKSEKTIEYRPEAQGHWEEAYKRFKQLL